MSTSLATSLVISTGPTSKSSLKVRCQQGLYPSNPSPVMASHDIHLALAPDDLHEEGTNRPDVYEVVLGGWGNQESAIRRGNQGRDLVHVKVEIVCFGNIIVLLLFRLQAF